MELGGGQGRVQYDEGKQMGEGVKENERNEGRTLSDDARVGQSRVQTKAMNASNHAGKR